MSNRFLISLSKGGAMRYLTMINRNSQSRIMCFETVKDAHRCKDYITHFKRTYGSWPQFNLSGTGQFSVDFESERLYNDDIGQHVNINMLDDNTLDFFCTQKQMSFLICNNFDVTYERNYHHVNFQGQEYMSDYITDDLFTNVKSLDNIFQNF